MKPINSLLFISVLTAGLEFTPVHSWAKDGILSSVKMGTVGDYCHMHFPAMEERTLSWDRPILKSAASSGDIIHLYGPCDYDPHGKEEVAKQKRERQRREFTE